MSAKKNEVFSTGIIRLVLIGSFLTLINTVVSTMALGFAQGFIVAFTTPFAFALSKLLFPRMFFSATILYFPLVITSVFTINFGPPGFPKILFILSSIIYDLVSYFMGIRKYTEKKIPLIKLIIPIIFYPLGLLVSAFLILKLFNFEIPIISEGIKLAIIMVLFFALMGSFSTFICHRVYYRWVK